MPALQHRNPAYRKHRASGQAIVTIDGKDHYLGPHGSRASRIEYDRIIAEWLANGRRKRVAAEVLTIAELMVGYLDHAKSYYRGPDGKPTKEVCSIKEALRPLRKLYARTIVDDFGPLSLKAVRQEMISIGWVRTRINHQIGRIRRMFKWGVENEMVSPTVLHGLKAVQGLMQGRSDAREGVPVKPVAEGFVQAVMLFLSKQICAMIKLQLLTGARPGEVIQMRGCDLDTSGRLWLYKPASHKTAHHGHDRVIYIGPQAQEVLRPFLRPILSEHLFSPADAEAERRAAMHTARRIPLGYGNRPGTNTKRRPQRRPGDRYTVTGYNRAVARACELAFPEPADLARGRVETLGRRKGRWERDSEWKTRLGPEKWAELNRWRKAHHFHVHQLRHTAGTELRKKYGLEAAQVILGHKTLSVTEIYAEKNVAAAQQIMSEVG